MSLFNILEIEGLNYLAFPRAKVLVIAPFQVIFMCSWDFHHKAQSFTAYGSKAFHGR